MAILRHKVLYNASAAGTGDWFELDTSKNGENMRSIHGQVAAGDTIVIQGTTIRAADRTALAEVITSTDIATLKTFTSDFADTLLGTWSFIRVVKTGANGTSKVQGLI